MTPAYLVEMSAQSKDKQTSLAPFDDHIAAVHGSHVLVTHRYCHSCKRNFTNFCCKQIQQSTWLGRMKRSASLFSCCRLSSFQQSHVMKSSLGRKSEHCPYPKLRQSIKRITMNFLTKWFSLGGGKSDFEILIFFALSNLTIAVKFLTSKLPSCDWRWLAKCGHMYSE